MKRSSRFAAFILFCTAAVPFVTQAQVPPGLIGQTPTLAPMRKNAMPAVVNVSVTSKVESQTPLMQDPFVRRFFGVPEDQGPQEREAQSIGSGVIIDAAKGYVLTNHHVVEQADTIQIRLTERKGP